MNINFKYHSKYRKKVDHKCVVNIGTYMSVHFLCVLSSLYIFIYHKSLPNAIFVQPEELCIVKAKKMRDMFIKIHYIVIKSRMLPRQKRETTTKKIKQNWNKVSPLRILNCYFKRLNNTIYLAFKIKFVELLSFCTEQYISYVWYEAGYFYGGSCIDTPQEPNWCSVLGRRHGWQQFLVQLFFWLFSFFNAKQWHHTNLSA